MYQITDYSFQQAKKLNVIIKPSTRKGKKIDVYDNNNKFIISIGDINYSDYPSYIKEKGLKYADERRRLYHVRHKKDSNLAGKFAKNILW
jgi:hypothetical protein